MKRILYTAACMAAVCWNTACTTTPQKETQKAVNYAACVNPMIGTDYTGNTYPGASAPFGMVQLSPDNGIGGWDRIAGYYYPDSTIAGFSHTHLTGTGAGDLYDISFMPVTLPYKEAKGEMGIHSAFSHQDEKAEAGYYRVKLSDYNILVELTATPRCGIQKYTFPKGNSAIILNLAKAMNWDMTDDSFIEVIDSCTIQGYRHSKGWAPDQKLFFATKFSRPFIKDSIVVNALADNHGYKANGKGYRAFFYFDTENQDSILVKTALSAVDVEGAQKNLEAETSGNDFNSYLSACQQEWNKELSRIKVETDDEKQKTVFYTALYHAMLAPTLYSDVDGRYRGADQQIHKADGWNNYSTFSIWDTYRAAHPLYNLILPERSKDMMESLMAFAEQNGRLPVWNFAACETDMMIGYHSAAVLAEAYLKGIPVDGKRILELAKKTAHLTDYRGLGDYQKLGYVPCDKEGESVSKTLEYAYDDYAIARLAEAVGDKAAAEEFQKRGESSFNLWNPQCGFFCPKDSKGKFKTPFAPMDYTTDYTESNAWQYLWSVPQNVNRLCELLGGKKGLEKKLDEMFSTESPQEDLPIFSTGMIGQYAQGNEPSHHVAYLYNYTDAPEKGQDLLRRIQTEFYKDTPAGLCGNEDCGQMSSWYVFSALGFYPIDPVSGYYEIGCPTVREAELDINGKTLHIVVKGNGRSAHVKKVTLNGQDINNRRVAHKDLMKGGTLLFEME